jgi:hypothetical protein
MNARAGNIDRAVFRVRLQRLLHQVQRERHGEQLLDIAFPEIANHVLSEEGVRSEQ